MAVNKPPWLEAGHVIAPAAVGCCCRGADGQAGERRATTGTW